MSATQDAFAWFYDRYWAAAFQEWEMPAIEKLLFPELAVGASVLDLCCGTGHLAKKLAARGYKLTCINGSREMLHIAHEKVPEANFRRADAVKFTLEQHVDAAVCAFDSLNQLLEPERLEMALGNVRAALKPGGCFVFDINTEEAYGERWKEPATAVHPGHAFFLRGSFDAATRIGTTKITMFRLIESWCRSDIEIRQRPWEVPEVRTMLRRAGFREIDNYRAHEDLGMNGNLGIGRVYFRAYR